MTCPTVTEMKRTRPSNLKASRRYSGRQRKRRNRSSGPRSSDYNLLEPRLLLAADFGDAANTYPVTLAQNGARHGQHPWEQLGSDIDGITDDNSGWSVSMSGDGTTMAVGAPGNNDNGVAAGQVKLFRWNGSTWKQMGQNLNGTTSRDTFGWAVSLSEDGNTIAVGTDQQLRDNPFGYTQIFRWDGNQWDQLGGTIEGAGAPIWKSGMSVSLRGDGNAVAIAGGKLEKFEQLSHLSHILTYEWSGSDWVQLGKPNNRESAGKSSF